MYVVFHIKTTKILQLLKSTGGMGCWADARFKTIGAAKACITRQAKKGKIVSADYGIASIEDYRKIEQTEEVINLMTGAKVTQSVNTPRCCDPSSELYWSM